MDLIASIGACLGKWSQGGEDECRTKVASLHCEISDPKCAEALATAYQTLLYAMLQTWSITGSNKLGSETLVAFIQRVLSSLPSTSTASVDHTRNLVAFGELLIDLMWSIDSQLDEIISDMRPKATAEGAGNAMEIDSEQAKDATLAKERAENMWKVAERDKQVLGDLLRRLLAAGTVSPSICRERLDLSLLNMVGLFPNKELIEKKEIRARTSLFYKQNKFNLLREQSEGYSKLIADLTTSMGPPHSPATGLPTENLQTLKARASAAWGLVVNLIGYFDLDPNRALDVILDVFSVNLAAHWQFFLALLAFSPWVGDGEPLKDWDQTSNLQVPPGQYRGKALDEVLRIAEENACALDSRSQKKETQKKPKVLAQVLGFKFSHYQSSDTKEPCPMSLYLMAALLIRNRFITLEDLYPHLSPADDHMPKLRQKYMGDVQARIKSSSNNLLAMAAPLESGSLGAPKPKVASTEQKASDETKEAPAQKAMITVALLSVGAIRQAIALLTRYPWLIDARRELADLLLLILRTSIAPLHDGLFHKERSKSFLVPRARYVPPYNLVTPSRKPHLTLVLPAPPCTHTHEFVFFYPLWFERVPLCHTVEDVVDIIEPLMQFVHIYLGRSPLFLSKLLRIGRTQLAQSINDSECKDGKKSPQAIVHPANDTQEFWLRVVRQYLLPALSMMNGNAICTVDVWHVLRQYEYTVRWRLYGEWRDVLYNSHPELKVQRVLREREAKGILRRLSSQTVESLAGTVAKMAHTNPCIFFTNAVSQIQAYDNLADVVIQALRYATNMGFDILVFIIVDALSNPDKERVKEDGANPSDWLQNLATFTGALFRRYSSDLSAVLKYIVHQLYNGQMSEIIVLEKLILKMAGIEPLPSLSDAQIVGMAGGPTLRIETVGSDIRGAGLDVAEVALKGTQRLGRTLIDTKLALPMLVQIAQQRQACVFRATDAHLKSLGYLYDTTHGVLFQYLDFLTTPNAVSLDEYRKIIPSLPDLCNRFGMCPSITMQIVRPILNDAVLKCASEWIKAKELEKAERAEATEKRLKAALAAKRETSGAPAAPDSPATPSPAMGGLPNGNVDQDKMDIDSVQANGERLSEKMDATNTEVQKTESPWVLELQALFEECKQIAPGNAFETIGPGFYLTFWQMSSYDLYFPKEKYAEMEEALNAKQRHLERSTDRSRVLSTSSRNQRERITATVQELRRERSQQELVYRYTTDPGGRLDKEKGHWFSHVGGAVKVANVIQSLIEHCIQPRCLLSPIDAVYCAKLIRTLHEQGTPGFHTLMCYDKLLGEHVKVIIFSCSENEARNYGRFLKGVLQDLFEWHQNQMAYESSSYRKEGSKTIVLPGLQTIWSKDGPSSPDDLLKWPDFKSFLKKCHRKLGRCFIDCIQAGDFMHVYNAVLVLKEIIEVFPVAAVNEVVGSSIDLEIQRLVQSEERGDLKVLARAYSSSLKKREKVWVMPQLAQAIKPVPSKPVTPVPQLTTEKQRDVPAVSAPTVPSGPRAVLSPNAHEKSTPERPTTERSLPERPSSSRLGLDSIPRPEVVKRNRSEVRTPETIQVEVPLKDQVRHPEPQQQAQVQSVQTPQSASPVHLPGSPAMNSRDEMPSTPPTHVPRLPVKAPVPHAPTDLRKEILQSVNGLSRPATPQASPQATTAQLTPKDLPQSPRTRDKDISSQQSMAPPTAPSQTLEAQELRQRSATVGRVDKERSPQEVGPEISEASARRSPSPSTRPGTRDHSEDSHMSGEGKRERIRHERPVAMEVDTEPSKRPSTVEVISRAERSGREAGHGRSERNGRDRIPGSSTRDAEHERERERGRDRERDRDRDREKERPHRDRDRDRDREKDRERDRSDRHRRERKPSASKSSEAQADLAFSSRSDASRHREHTGSTHSDEALGKRRRPIDDEPERSTKRSSRSHREERRKDGSRERRETDRRRKEREAVETETSIKGAAAEKSNERSRGTEPPTPTTPRVAGPPPSAPRAMAGHSPRNSGRSDAALVPSSRDKDREHDRERSERERAERDRVERDRGERADRSDRGLRIRDSKAERSDERAVPPAAAALSVDTGGREWKTSREAEAVGLTARDAARSDRPIGGPTLTSQPSSSSLRERISGGLGPASQQQLSGPSPPPPPPPPPATAATAPPAIAPARVVPSGSNPPARDDHDDARKRFVTDYERDTLMDTSGPEEAVAQPTGQGKKQRILYRNRYETSLARRAFNNISK